MKRMSMKRMSMFLFAAVAANAILPARCGDSAPFLLDTADGTRIATEGEAIPIAYSPRWGNAASCTVDLGGSRSVATESAVAVNCAHPCFTSLTASGGFGRLSAQEF